MTVCLIWRRCLLCCITTDSGLFASLRTTISSSSTLVGATAIASVWTHGVVITALSVALARLLPIIRWRWLLLLSSWWLCLLGRLLMDLLLLCLSLQHLARARGWHPGVGLGRMARLWSTATRVEIKTGYHAAICDICGRGCLFWTTICAAQTDDWVKLMRNYNLQVVARFWLNTCLCLKVSWSTSTIHFSLLQLLVDIFAVFADWVQRFHQHAIWADLWCCRGSSSLWQINCKVGNHKRTAQIIRLKLGRLERLLLRRLWNASLWRRLFSMLRWCTAYTHIIERDTLPRVVWVTATLRLPKTRMLTMVRGVLQVCTLRSQHKIWSMCFIDLWDIFKVAWLTSQGADRVLSVAAYVVRVVMVVLARQRLFHTEPWWGDMWL